VVIADAKTHRIEDVIDLRDPAEVPLGWCRGLSVVDETTLWIGFSRIRPTKFREHVSWVKSGFRKPKPTHIALYDLRTRTPLQEIDLEPVGVHTVFSVISNACGHDAEP
jgi:hypothetical protein